jgi:hypothetical protein
MPHAYTYDLDQFYAGEQGKIEAAEKPRSKRPSHITLLVKEIEASGQPGFSDVCETFLELDVSSAARIGREMRQIVDRFRAMRREISFSVTSKALGVGVTVAIRDVWPEEAIEAAQTWDTKRRASRWITIFLQYEGNQPRFVRFVDHSVNV